MKNSIVILGAVLLASCGSGPQKQQPLTYQAPSLKIQAEQAVSQIINADYPFVYPTQMQCVDSTIVILDMMAPEYFLHVFDLNGQWLADFGRKGKGPGELLSPQQFFRHPGNVISVYSSDKIVEYDLAGILQSSQNAFREIRVPVSPALQIVPYASDRYFAMGTAPQWRFGIYDSKIDSLIFSYNQYPQLFKQQDNQLEASIFSYGPRVYFKPDYTQFVQTTYIGAVLDIYTLSDRNIKADHTEGIYMPEYTTMPGEGRHITWGDNTTIGFEGATTTQDHIYTLLNGIKGSELKKPNPEHPFTDKITVFDWEGHLLSQIQAGCMLTTIAIDEASDVFYATSYSEGVFRLVKIQKR